MIAVFRLFLMLFAPMLAVVTAGLFLVLRTGQVDPWLWSGGALVFLAIAGLLLPRRIALTSAMGSALSILLFCTIAAERAPMPGAALGVLWVCLSSSFGASMLRSPRRRILGGALLGCAMLLSWWGPRLGTGRVAQRPSLAVLTALPLFWDDGGMARIDAPIITTLRDRFAVRPIDSPAELRAGDRLLLAQPRDLGPQGLVAIDAWVRRGGQALLLADLHLAWPSRLPIGDRRRAPMTTTLSPLLLHWGVRVSAVDAGETRRFLHDDRLVTTMAAGRLQAAGSHCQATDDALVMRCRVGQGQAIIVADADLLDDRLWLDDPARPRNARGWVADTPDLVATWLRVTTAGDRRWLRDGVTLRTAMRWMVLLGLGWAAMGSVVFAARKQRKRHKLSPGHPPDATKVGL